MYQNISKYSEIKKNLLKLDTFIQSAAIVKFGLFFKESVMEIYVRSLIAC